MATTRAAEACGVAVLRIDDDQALDRAPVGPEAGATLWFGSTTTAEARRIVEACYQLGRPCLLISPEVDFTPVHVASWITRHGIKTLHVAGDAQADEPWLSPQVDFFLAEVLRLLGQCPGGSE
jgi:hypothetical protein